MYIHIYTYLVLMGSFNQLTILTMDEGHLLLHHVDDVIPLNFKFLQTRYVTSLWTTLLSRIYSLLLASAGKQNPPECGPME